MIPLLVTIVTIFGLLGTPIFAVFAILALSLFVIADESIIATTIEMLRLGTHPTLLAIPLFTFAGYLMAESKTPSRLLRLSQYLVGWLPGGIAIVSLAVCAVFTAFTGGSGVTIVALGGLLYPMLMKKGYSENFTLGLISSSGAVGLLFPPSLAIILYGMIAGVNIDDLFLAGIIPGFVLIIVLALYSMYMGRNSKMVSSPEDDIQFSWSGLKESLWDCRFEIPIPFLVLIGIYGGFATASETSAIVAAYVLLMTCFFYRDLDWRRDLPQITKDSMTLVGAILLILACALGMVNYMISEEIPMKLVEFMRQHIDSKITFLLLLNVFLLFVGMMLDIFTAIIVIVPIIVPIANEFGVHPVHLAIIFLTNLEIGYLTPPVGLNLFISSFRFNKPVTTIYKASIPFLILMLIALALLTYIPEISLLWIDD
ncbi:MAG: TRAP transporter large permease [Oligoflexus sp.]